MGAEFFHADGERDRQDGRTDMTQLIVASHNSENRHKLLIFTNHLFDLGMYLWDPSTVLLRTLLLTIRYNILHMEPTGHKLGCPRLSSVQLCAPSRHLAVGTR